MQLRSLFILFVLLCFCTALFAQQSAHDRFSHTIVSVKGDLNKDGLEDKATLTQDTVADTAPYRLQIHFAQPGGGYKLAVSTEKAIDPQYPDGREGYRTGNQFGEIAIENGALVIRADLLRGNYEHKFRHQNSNFELIGFKEVSSDGHGIMTTTDFNLSTGWREEKRERYDTDKVLSNSKKKVWIRPLPKLQDFRPLQTELY